MIISSRRWAPQSCRSASGLVLDEQDSWRVCSFPYIKFFNYGEKRAVVDWSTAVGYALRGFWPYWTADPGYGRFYARKGRS